MASRADFWAERRGELAVVCLQPDDLKGHRLSHPGQYGDLPDGALPQPQGGLIPGDDSGPAAQPDVKIFLTVTSLCHGLQHGAAAHGLSQGVDALQCLAVFLPVQQSALR